MRNWRRRRMKKLASLISLVVIISLMAACGNTGNTGNSGHTASPANESQPSADASETNQESKAQVRTVKHDKGESSVPDQPQRVVVLSDLGFEDNLLSMGLVPVGVPTYEGVGFTPYLADQLKTAKGIDPYNPNLQEIASLNPDLIICTDAHDPIYAQLNKIAPTVLLAYDPDWRKVHLKLGEIVGKTKEAEEALRQYDASAADIKARIKAKIGKESVMFIMMSEKMIRVQGTTGHALNDLLYAELGLTPPAGIPTTESRVELSLEGLSKFDPDHIFLVEYQNVDAVKNSSVWKGLKAVANNNVYPADGFWMAMCWGPQGRSLVLQQIADVLKA